MLVLACFAQNAKTHVVVWATLVHVSKLTVVAFLALVLHELLAYLDIVAEVALVTIRTTAQILKLVAWLYLAPVV